FLRHGYSASGLHRVGWLVARAVQIAITLLALGLFIVGLPARYQRLLALGLGNLSLTNGTPSSDPARVQTALARLGASAYSYAASYVALEISVALVFCVVALAVARGKRDSGFSVFVSLALVVIGVTYPPTIDELGRAHPDWELGIGILGSLGFAFALVL